MGDDADRSPAGADPVDSRGPSSGGVFDELNRNLERVRRRATEKAHRAALLQRALADLASLRAKRERWAERVRKEQKDVEKLEGLGLAALFHAVLGNREERHRKEREEYLAAKLKLDQVEDELEGMREEVERLRETVAALGNPEEEERELLRRKDAALVAGPHADPTLEEARKECVCASREIGALEEELREIVEAQESATVALRSLRAALCALDSAANWGTFDLVMGGTLATMAKHGHVDTARREVFHAQRALNRLRRELGDVERVQSPRVEIGGFETFCDYFFDGLISDWVVQSRIGDSRQSVASTLAQCDRILSGLTQRRNELESKHKELIARRRDLVESARGPGT